MQFFGLSAHLCDVLFRSGRMALQCWLRVTVCAAYDGVIILYVQLTFGQVPVLDDGADRFPQSNAILRHLGRKFGRSY